MEKGYLRVFIVQNNENAYREKKNVLIKRRTYLWIIL